MPPMPAGVEQGILKGLYKFKPGPQGRKHQAHIFGSGPIILSALKAQEILAERYNISADIWSATRDRPDLVSDDHMHPNDRGHRVIADLYWQHITSMLPPTPRTPSACPYAVSDLTRVVS